MHNKVALFILVLLLLFPATIRAKEKSTYSTNSLIVEATANACMGKTLSREATEQKAMTNVKRAAAEQAISHVSSTSVVKDGLLAEDIILAYTNSTINILDTLSTSWKQDTITANYSDECYHITVKAEVVPIKQSAPIIMAGDKASPENDPLAPLTIKAWTDKTTYKLGESMHIYFKGNKPFYARIIYFDASGQLIEISEYRTMNYFNGGVVYTVPGAEDNFTLQIAPPLGSETLKLYASTQPITPYQGKSLGNNMKILVASASKIDSTTRGLVIVQNKAAQSTTNAEFAEVHLQVKTIQ